MNRNFSLAQNMQISKENAYVCGTDDLDNLKKLSKEYNLRKIDELKKYLQKDGRLVPYILSIAPTINNYFPEHGKYLTYCMDPEFSELSQAVICVVGNDSSFKEDHELMNGLIDEILSSTDFPVEVKSMISVRMWWM